MIKKDKAHFSIFEEKWALVSKHGFGYFNEIKYILTHEDMVVNIGGENRMGKMNKKSKVPKLMVG